MNAGKAGPRQEGSALIIVLVFLVALSALAAATLGFAATSFASANSSHQRQETIYAAEAAMEWILQKVASGSACPPPPVSPPTVASVGYVNGIDTIYVDCAPILPAGDNYSLSVFSCAEVLPCDAPKAKRLIVRVEARISSGLVTVTDWQVLPVPTASP